MCIKAVNNFPSTILFVPKCYKTQASTCFFLFDSVLDQNKIQKMCDEAADDCLAALKFVPDCFVANKMLKKFLANGDIPFFDEDFSKVTLSANEMSILGVDLDKIKLDDDNNFYEDDREIIIYVRLLA